MPTFDWAFGLDAVGVLKVVLKVVGRADDRCYRPPSQFSGSEPAADYYACCSRHDPFGSGVRRCVNALIAAGEVSRAEVARRAAAAR